uniref:Uncharacterized protein n=1 Tax=Cannabis sativa TaxID=3483 RepID=A0A803Q318_CANSA
MRPADAGSFYLGLPSTIGKNKSTLLGYLKDRVQKRLQGWGGNFLSRAGKEVLIKSIYQSLPSYAMSMFLLPLEITLDIEKMMTSFWQQSSSKSNKGIQWMSWDRLSHHKSGGGFIWRRIWDSQQLVKAGVRWCVGDGSPIGVWFEPWLPNNNNPFVSCDHPSLSHARPSHLSEGAFGVEQIRHRHLGFTKNVGYLDQQRNAQNSDDESSWSSLQAGNGAKHWTSPFGDRIKVNVDVAIFEGGRGFGISLVARDDKGLLSTRS